MLSSMMPDQFAESIYDIDREALRKKGIKGVITDLDNTLVAWDTTDATPELLKWLDDLHDEGFKVTIVSNNNRKRVRTFSEPTGVSFIYSAKKPMKRSFRRAAEEMGLKKEEVAVIGDQILTDVFGGNRGGYYTILVAPVSETDKWTTKVNRKIERLIMRKRKMNRTTGGERMK
ncbi:YqeG family HAD IIIA-type phosphatase [Salicibibacter cibarius]|uniref:YqeG family HAD IIIA-type phosphatase n=1 Tax=Salicibibacter cibarius TaxID=2743000 RepID=A0A7T6Z3K6_9BACI|nr:YqeG family HAD IIIA-type phosphatase [Salicibibacter cibarius]QQK75791.1 YqeG family HAD IIIA-type phosphatase [Salicibibacter cibarius]